MNPLKEIFEPGQTILWIETQNTVAFLRPVPDILVWTPCPTAGVAQPLRIRQVRFTAPEGLLGPLAIFNVGDDTIPFDDVAGFISQRNATLQMPAILPVGAAETHLVLKRLAAGNTREPLSVVSLKIIAVSHGLPT